MSQLTDYIKKELDKGFSKSKIKDTLLKAKYPEAIVDRAFKEVDLEKTFAKKPSRIKKLNFKRFFRWIAIILVILLVIYLIFLLVTNFPSTCSFKSKGNSKDMCYFNKAVASEDTKYCEKIEQPWLFIPCGKEEPINPCRNPELPIEEKEQCWFEKAVEEKALNYCLLYIKDKDLRSKCSSEINRMLLQEMKIDLCGNNKDCYLQFALKANDPNICLNEDLDVYYQNDCIIDYGKQTTDKNSCHLLENDNYVKLCMA